jgi:methylmalonyl-CoA mutase
VQQIVSHRTSMGDMENALVLQKLAKIVGFQGAGLVETCADAAAAGATLGEITRAVRINDTPCSPVTPVCISRVAVPVEALRADMDHFVNSKGERPKVYLCNMGPLKEHKARADFSRGFFAVGGYEAISPAGVNTVEEAAAGFKESGAPIAVICSTDEKYPTLVPPLVTALRAARPDVFVVLAGYPQESVPALKAAGVNEFIHVRADAVEVLTGIHAKMGVS